MAALLYRSVTFKCDLVSALTPGTAPPYGFALRACGMAETASAAAVTGTAQSGSTTTTLKLAAAASSIDGVYVGARVRITGGAGSGQSATIIGYVGSTKVATVDRPWTVTPDATSLYSVDPFVRYNPVSDILTMESATFYYNEGNQVRHKLLGCRGNVKIDASAKDTGMLDFELIGLYGGVADAAETGVAVSNWVDPWEVGYGRTYGQVFGKPLTGGASGLQMGKFSLDLGQKAAYRSVVGYQGVIITDRAASGSLTLDATTVAQFDPWTLIAGNGTGAIGIEQPDSNNGSVRIDVPKAAPTEIDYGDDQGISTNTIQFDCQRALGNDEVFITCR
ncbi:conserved protein of unknown function [Methylococcus capsulatus]|uniref:Uncharacterized protein n=1 Tax=Methylococcus capsulatus TaxID=414 RepID=A0AA35UAB8_METCP|nr:hypothetical protein [Methylococcus capsulatus]CAI8742613.1 conserved protein of unknown function [Methylococcus capsulatus]